MQRHFCDLGKHPVSADCLEKAYAVLAIDHDVCCVSLKPKHAARDVGQDRREPSAWVSATHNITE